MELEELILKEQQLQSFLQRGDYTFIGPANPEYFEKFIKIANEFAPIRGINRSIHHVLSNKEAVRRALKFLPENIPLQLYVVEHTTSDQLLRTDFDNYLQQHAIVLDNID